MFLASIASSPSRCLAATALVALAWHPCSWCSWRSSGEFADPVTVGGAALGAAGNVVLARALLRRAA